MGIEYAKKLLAGLRSCILKKRATLDRVLTRIKIGVLRRRLMLQHIW